MFKPVKVTKHLITIYALACAAFLAVSCTDKESGMSDWQQQVESDLDSLERDFKELKAELKDNDMEAAKQRTLSEANEIKEAIQEKLEKAKTASKKEVAELKKEIQTSMSNLREKMSSQN